MKAFSHLHPNVQPKTMCGHDLCSAA